MVNRYEHGQTKVLNHVKTVTLPNDNAFWYKSKHILISWRGERKVRINLLLPANLISERFVKKLKEQVKCTLN